DVPGTQRVDERLSLGAYVVVELTRGSVEDVGEDAVDVPDDLGVRAPVAVGQVQPRLGSVDGDRHAAVLLSISRWMASMRACASRIQPSACSRPCMVVCIERREVW